LTNEQLAYVQLPEIYRGESREDVGPGPRVLLSAPFGGREYTWEGRIVRTEGSMDTSSRQLFVVAQVDDPYARQVRGRPPLKVGMFVNAEIQGEILEDVIVVPRETLRQGRELLLINDENRLERRRVDVIWSDNENVVVRESLEEGDLLCLTPMTFAAQGAKVQPSVENEKAGVDDAAPATETKLPAEATGKKGTS
jgi:multidrug efflux pump subunit AcrA (membrane-fusion protein)